MTGIWEEDETAIMIDFRGGKEGGIMTCWDGIKGVWMRDEMGTMVKSETIGGVDDEAEEEKVVCWPVNGLWVAWFNLVTKYSIFSNCCITSLS